jgi:nucleotide-binding universal stress UspA family protein
MGGPNRKKILVAVDGSNESISTVNYVAKMMPPAQTEVTLFHVFSKIPEAFWDVEKSRESDLWMDKIKALEVEHEKAVRTFMKNARQTFLDHNFREQFLKIEVQNRARGIARDIIAESKRNYDMLVMGSKGTSQLNGVPIGSVANKVLGILSSLPICVVSGNPNIQNIMIAMDGSESSMRAVDYLCASLNGIKRKIILFHAMRRIGYPESSTDKANPFKEIEEAVWEDTRKLIEPLMEKAQARLADAGLNDDIILRIVTGVPSRAKALIEEAKNANCGSIIVGRTGISRVEDFNIGRVCQKVLHRAKDIAVWVVP